MRHLRSNSIRLVNAGLFGIFLLGAVCIAASPGMAVTEEDFKVQTTSEYVALCETAPNQPNYVAAIHFCQGFASGAYQYYQASTAHGRPNTRFVCLPDPSPSRNEAISAFLAWTKANPAFANDAPVDSMFRYLAQTYPCPVK